MVHHIAFEISPDLMAAEGRFWLAAGFEEVSAPEALGPGFHWYERNGTQIHLMPTPEPAAPPGRGHVAVVAPELDESMRRIADEGCQVDEARRLWGARRAKAVTPSGHVVELMEAPPEPSARTFP